MSASNLLDAAVEAKAKDLEERPRRSRTLATRVVEEAGLAFDALAKEKGKKSSELLRTIVYAYLDQMHRRKNKDR